MFKRFRRILFIAFNISCFVLLFAYTFLQVYGYEFNGEGGIEKMSIIDIATVPRGAEVFLDNAEYSDKTPVAIRNITPGFYHLRLEKEGYLPWEREIEVKEDLVTLLRPVYLHLDPGSNPANDLAKSTDLFVVNPENENLIAAVDDNLKLLKILNLTARSGVEKIFELGEEIKGLNWVSSGEIALLGKRDIFIFDLYTSKVEKKKRTVRSWKRYFGKIEKREQKIWTHNRYEIFKFNAKTEKLELFTRYSKPIDQLITIGKGESFLLNQQGEVKICGQDLNCSLLVMIEPQAKFSYLPRKKALLYQKEGSLKLLSLFPGEGGLISSFFD